MKYNELTLEWVIENLPIDHYFRGCGIDCISTTENKIKLLIRKALKNSDIKYYEFDIDGLHFDEDNNEKTETNFEFEIDSLLKGYPSLYKKLLLNDFHALLFPPFTFSIQRQDFESVWTIYNEQIDEEKEIFC